MKLSFEGLTWRDLGGLVLIVAGITFVIEGDNTAAVIAIIAGFETFKKTDTAENGNNNT